VELVRDGLDAVGFDWTQPAMFSWLGVTSYLSVDAIEQTLRTVASAASGSEIVLSYLVTRELMDDDDHAFFGILARLTASSSEPLQSFFAPDDIDSLVARSGLVVRDHATHNELIRRYFADRTDGLVPYAEGLVAAGVP